MTGPASAKPDRELRISPLVVFGVWTLYGLIVYTQMVLSRTGVVPAPWKPYGPLVLWLSHAWLWAAATPLVAWMVRHARPTLARPHLLLAHIATLAVIHAVATVVDGGAFYLIAKRLPATLFQNYRFGFAQSLLLYSTVTLAVLALDHARLARSRAIQAARLEADLTRARLETLRRQIQPHFLFNTLNTIAELIDTDPARAGEMVARLGELLRRSLDEHERPLIPLQAELDFVRLYSDIERVRFESWLSVDHNIDAAALDAWVPPMILQPIVENAIKHGIAPSKRKGTITIRASRPDAHRLVLEVQDDGVGMRVADGNARQGIGLATTRERLAHLFGGNAALEVISGNGAGTRVILDLPFIVHGRWNGSRSANDSPAHSPASLHTQSYR